MFYATLHARTDALSASQTNAKAQQNYSLRKGAWPVVGQWRRILIESRVEQSEGGRINLGGVARRVVLE